MPRTRSGYYPARSGDADETHDSPTSDSGTDFQLNNRKYVLIVECKNKPYVTIITTIY